MKSVYKPRLKHQSKKGFGKKKSHKIVRLEGRRAVKNVEKYEQGERQ